MAKVLALIALVLLSGFSGGNDVFATTHPPQLTFQVVLSPANESAEAMSQSGHASDKDASDEVVSGATECCMESSCANASHCHHSGLSAMMASQLNSVTAMLRGGYRPSRHDLPTLSVAYSISKPPRA